MNYRIMTNDCTHPINVYHIEQQYGGKYIGDFCIKTKQGWSEEVAAIFYQPNPNFELGHTHYFGILCQQPHRGLVYDEDYQVAIINGESAFSEPIDGIIADDGEVIYSRYRHDFVTSSDGSVSIDGGRDYVRCMGSSVLNFNRRCLLTIDKDKLIIMDPVEEQI